MTAILTNLFDGVAYGMLLFVLACGLAVTLGLTFTVLRLLLFAFGVHLSLGVGQHATPAGSWRLCTEANIAKCSFGQDAEAELNGGLDNQKV